MEELPLRARDLRSNSYTMKDARDLVVLAVGGSYLQAVAAKARVVSARAQLDTATALYQQASQQRGEGLLAQTDVNRSRVQMLTDKERLETLLNDLAKQKINLARMTGLPPNDQYDIADDIPYSPAPAIEVNDALQQAYINRQDLKASEAQVRASELTRSAARAELLPSLAVNGDYGVNGTNPTNHMEAFQPPQPSRFQSGGVAALRVILSRRRPLLRSVRLSSTTFMPRSRAMCAMPFSTCRQPPISSASRPKI